VCLNDDRESKKGRWFEPEPELKAIFDPQIAPKNPTLIPPGQIKSVPLMIDFAGYTIKKIKILVFHGCSEKDFSTWTWVYGFCHLQKPTCLFPHLSYSHVHQMIYFHKASLPLLSLGQQNPSAHQQESWKMKKEKLDFEMDSTILFAYFPSLSTRTFNMWIKSTIASWTAPPKTPEWRSCNCSKDIFI